MADKSLVIIRQATADDLPEIVRMLADDPLGSQREHYIEGQPLAQAYLNAYAEIAADPRQELIVAELDGRVVGTLQITFLRGISFQGGRRMQIEAVRVDRSLRSQGIGQQMMEWVIQHARQQGCFVIQLTTDKSRNDAHRFYERLGFVASHLGMKLRL